MTPDRPLPPGSVVGIVGGGQLGRMTAIAAAKLGYRCHVLDPDARAPAAEVAASATTAPYEDLDAARNFAASVDVATFEFENVPLETLAAVGESAPVRPSVEALRVSQDRAVEKAFVNGLGIATAEWAEIRSADDLEAAAGRIGLPAILKTARFGYDGKGQTRIDGLRDLAQALRTAGEARTVLEGAVAFEREISVTVARGLEGETAAYVPVENLHRDGILRVTTAPAAIADPLADEAVGIARRLAAGLDLFGLLTVEMFVTLAGDVLVNEIAPRPHNSGHWTVDACAIGQFEQLVRAVTGLPLGDPARHSDAVMTNLIGEDANAWADVAAEPGACLHLYGKAETRPGRKMGHVTRLTPVREPAAAA